MLKNDTTKAYHRQDLNDITTTTTTNTSAPSSLSSSTQSSSLQQKVSSSCSYIKREKRAETNSFDSIDPTH